MAAAEDTDALFAEDRLAFTVFCACLYTILVTVTPTLITPSLLLMLKEALMCVFKDICIVYQLLQRLVALGLSPGQRL